jgi:tRNA threonylcarbamoyl adenosine modification protein (Sua5/YciO/YrdC/YwlC family)
MTERFDLSDPAQHAAGMVAASEAIRKGELIVLPTDTVYGVGADAFTPWAVSRLLAAKGRGRDMPPPVLVGTVRAASALVDDFGPFGQDLIDEFWPGGLTLVARATPTLAWDLGDTKGTVAVRMPLHAAALDLLKATGPMAVSSANTTGRPAATTVDEAMEQLGDSISVYLDGGQCGGGVASTIIDLTGSVPRLLRAGAISMDSLRQVAALITGDEVPEPEVNGTAVLPEPGDPESATGDAADEAVPDGPPDIPSDSPADARADALTAAGTPAPATAPHPPADAVDASSPPDPVDTTLRDGTGDAHVSAGTPEAWDIPGPAADDPVIPVEARPEAPAEDLMGDSAQAQQAADDPAAPVTSEAATAAPPAAASGKKAARTRKTASARKAEAAAAVAGAEAEPAAGETPVDPPAAAPRKPAARKAATERKPAARKPATARKTTPRRATVSKTTPAEPPTLGDQTDTASQPGGTQPGDES